MSKNELLKNIGELAELAGAGRLSDADLRKVNEYLRTFLDEVNGEKALPDYLNPNSDWYKGKCLAHGGSHMP